MIKQNFIITSLQPWDISIGSNAKDIALEISKSNRVVYVSTPLDYKTYYHQDTIAPNIHRRNVIDKKEAAIRKINENLWIVDFPFCILPINRIPDGFIFDLFNRINNRKIFAYIRNMLKLIDFQHYIHFIDNDIYRSFYAPHYLDATLTIYYKRDNLTSDFWQKHALRLEPLLAQKADLVVANSEQLAATLCNYNSICQDIGQGVDLSNYQPEKSYPIPDDLSCIPHPIIGYMGYLTSKRLDLNLIQHIAEANPNYSFVLIGPEDSKFIASDLHKKKNIYFLGSKSAELVPTYISHFDICINPQAVNSITRGNYPRKIDEYLAFGKPTVATKTEAMTLFDHYVYNCTSVEEYNHAFSQALQEQDTDIVEQRIQFAQSHTWENCVNQLYQLIESKK